jgi:hypothetical protein
MLGSEGEGSGAAHLLSPGQDDRFLMAVKCHTEIFYEISATRLPECKKASRVSGWLPGPGWISRDETITAAAT